MKIRIAIAVAAALVQLTGHAVARTQTFSGTDTKEVQKLAIESHAQFQERLRDYGSARFKGVTGRYTLAGDARVYYICGEVQSKTGFGGYGGWKPFIVSRSRIELNVADLQFSDDSQSWPDDIFTFCGPDTGVIDRTFDYGPLLRSGGTRRNETLSELRHSKS